MSVISYILNVSHIAKKKMFTLNYNVVSPLYFFPPLSLRIFTIPNSLKAKALAWMPGDGGLIPSSATDLLSDLGQVNSPAS